MKHKYLLDAGVIEKDMPWNWNPEDGRQPFWEKQREEYGFDERETWSLDYTFRLWFYERLKMYNEINGIDTSYHKIEYKGKEYTQQECMDFILNAFEKTFKINGWEFKKEIVEEVQTAYDLIAKIMHLLWW